MTETLVTSVRQVPLLDLSALHAPIAHELDAAWRSVMDRQSFVLGQECEAFEAEWAAYCGTAHAVGAGKGS